MPSRLRLQYGALHIEYEGSDEFLKAELPALLEHIAKVLPAAPLLHAPAPGVTDSPPQTHLGSVRF